MQMCLGYESSSQTIDEQARTLQLSDTCLPRMRINRWRPAGFHPQQQGRAHSSASGPVLLAIEVDSSRGE